MGQSSMKKITSIFTAFIALFLSSAHAGSYSGKVTHLQAGNAQKASLSPLTGTSYLMVTLDPLPTITASCAKDPARRLIIDATTEHGKLMSSILIAAKAASQEVTLGGYSECVSQSSSGNTIEMINWVVSK